MSGPRAAPEPSPGLRRLKDSNDRLERRLQGRPSSQPSIPAVLEPAWVSKVRDLLESIPHDEQERARDYIRRELDRMGAVDDKTMPGTPTALRVGATGR